MCVIYGRWLETEPKKMKVMFLVTGSPGATSLNSTLCQGEAGSVGAVDHTRGKWLSALTPIQMQHEPLEG